MNGITMDGRQYRVRVVYNTLAREFALLSGPNAGVMLSGRKERDLIGTGYGYELAVEPDPQHMQDYYDFFEAISAPVDSHWITMPYNNSTMSFSAAVESGQDTFTGKLAGLNRWTGLKVRFSYVDPQRTAE